MSIYYHYFMFFQFILLIFFIHPNYLVLNNNDFEFLNFINFTIEKFFNFIDFNFNHYQMDPCKLFHYQKIFNQSIDL